MQDNWNESSSGGLIRFLRCFLRSSAVCIRPSCFVGVGVGVGAGGGRAIRDSELNACGACACAQFNFSRTTNQMAEPSWAGHGSAWRMGMRMGRRQWTRPKPTHITHHKNTEYVGQQKGVVLLFECSFALSFYIRHDFF